MSLNAAVASIAAPLAMNPFLAARLTSGAPPDINALIVDYLAYATTIGDPDVEAPATAPLSASASRLLISFAKQLFNYYFRHDLYAPHRQRDFLVLSSGSMHEPAFGLPASLKRCLQIALDRDWYGYSDSRGRINARSAVAVLENERLGSSRYTEDNVAISMGGTFALSSIVDYLTTMLPAGDAICAIPNYPPLVASLARRMPVQLVDTAPNSDGYTGIDEVINALTNETRIVLLQSVTNPTGLAVSEEALEQLIARLGPQTYLILDEAHDCLGPRRTLAAQRANPNVIRITSLSKQLAIPGMKVGWLLASREFVDGFYEYASTTYGGPPSFFYSLIDVYATFEQMRLAQSRETEIDGIRGVADRYGTTVSAAAAWFATNTAELNDRERKIVNQRAFAVNALREAGFAVTAPQYSVNCTLSAIEDHSGYGFYRRALRTAGVSVYPNILGFDLTDTSVRVTLGRDVDELRSAIDRLGRCIRP